MDRRTSTERYRPFLYETRPFWLVRLEPEPGELSTMWVRILAFVADDANESGFFASTSESWAMRSGLDRKASQAIAKRFLEAGGLERNYGRLYVAGWRETYRHPASGD